MSAALRPPRVHRHTSEPSTSSSAVITTYWQARDAVRAGLEDRINDPRSPKGAAALLEDIIVHKITALAGYQETTVTECGGNETRLHDNQNDLHLSISVPPDAEVCSLVLEVESHDQGWASSDEVSYTWGEVGWVGVDLVSVAAGCHRIQAFVNAVADHKWQCHRCELAGDQLQQLLASRPQQPWSHSLGFYVRSQYPAWVCYVRGARFTMRWVPASPGVCVQL